MGSRLLYLSATCRAASFSRTVSIKAYTRHGVGTLSANKCATRNEYLIFQKIARLEYEFPDGFDIAAKELVKQLLVRIHLSSKSLGRVIK